MFLSIFSYSDSAVTYERTAQKLDSVAGWSFKSWQHSCSELKQLIILHQARLATLMFNALNMAVALYNECTLGLQICSISIQGAAEDYLVRTLSQSIKFIIVEIMQKVLKI